MARSVKRKTSTTKNIIFGALCAIVGFVVGVLGNIFLSLPDSYKIPAQVSVSSTAAGKLDDNAINSSELSIHFLELGNKYTGDCILIKSGDTEILVDGGSKASSIPYIESYVDKYVTDNRLEFVIVTHAHEDHYAGFATNSSTESLFDYYTNGDKTIGTIITFAKTNKKESNTMYKNFSRELGEAKLAGAQVFTALECWNNAPVLGTYAQRSYNIGSGVGNDAKLEILYQKFYVESSSTENNYSVCFKITQYGKTYLFTGDLEADGEASLISPESGNQLGEVELYKAGHHGSKTSSSAELMSVIKPKIVVVCCVAGSSEYTSKNENQFPTQAFVDNVLPYTSDVFVTSLCTDYAAGQFESFNGMVVICAARDKNTRVLCSNNTVVLQDTDWFKENRKLPENAKRK